MGLTKLFSHNTWYKCRILLTPMITGPVDKYFPIYSKVETFFFYMVYSTVCDSFFGFFECCGFGLLCAP